MKFRLLIRNTKKTPSHPIVVAGADRKKIGMATKNARSNYHELTIERTAEEIGALCLQLVLGAERVGAHSWYIASVEVLDTASEREAELAEALDRVQSENDQFQLVLKDNFEEIEGLRAIISGVPTKPTLDQEAQDLADMEANRNKFRKDTEQGVAFAQGQAPAILEQMSDEDVAEILESADDRPAAPEFLEEEAILPDPIPEEAPAESPPEVPQEPFLEEEAFPLPEGTAPVVPIDEPAKSPPEVQPPAENPVEAQPAPGPEKPAITEEYLKSLGGIRRLRPVAKELKVPRYKAIDDENELIAAILAHVSATQGNG